MPRFVKPHSRCWSVRAYGAGVIYIYYYKCVCIIYIYIHTHTRTYIRTHINTYARRIHTHTHAHRSGTPSQFHNVKPPFLCRLHLAPACFLRCNVFDVFDVFKVRGHATLWVDKIQRLHTRHVYTLAHRCFWHSHTTAQSQRMRTHSRYVSYALTHQSTHAAYTAHFPRAGTCTPTTRSSR